MVISETMSNYSDWMQLYQNNFTSTQIETPPTTTTALAVAATYSCATSGSRNNNLIPEQGRISKPIRRRSRASRQTPTTLHNTDITNFRAMVQHFTGGPATRPQLPGGGATFSQQAPGCGAPAGGFYVQCPTQLPQQQHAFLSSVNNRLGGTGSGGSRSHAPPPRSSSMNEDGDHDNYMPRWVCEKTEI